MRNMNDDKDDSYLKRLPPEYYPGASVCSLVPDNSRPQAGMAQTRYPVSIPRTLNAYHVSIWFVLPNFRPYACPSPHDVDWHS